LDALGLWLAKQRRSTSGKQEDNVDIAFPLIAPEPDSLILTEGDYLLCQQLRDGEKQ
jgi:hypothetical protein